MAGWLVSTILAALVALVVLALGGSEPLLILVVMMVWFVVLAGVALAIETAIQAIGRVLRRGS